MIRLWRSAAKEPGVTLITELTGEQVAAIHTGIRSDPLCCLTLDSSVPKFRGELGSCIVWLLVRAMQLTLPQALDLFTKINHRENLGSTGIGRGFGVPHARTGLVQEPRACSVLFRDHRFEYDALDQEPIHGICLMLVKPSEPGESLRVNLDRSPASILREPDTLTNGEAYRESMIRNFNLREPLMEEWHSERFASSESSRPPSE